MATYYLAVDIRHPVDIHIPGTYGKQENDPGKENYHFENGTG